MPFLAVAFILHFYEAISTNYHFYLKKPINNDTYVIGKSKNTAIMMTFRWILTKKLDNSEGDWNTNIESLKKYEKSCTCQVPTNLSKELVEPMTSINAPWNTDRRLEIKPNIFYARENRKLYLNFNLWISLSNYTNQRGWKSMALTGGNREFSWFVLHGYRTMRILDRLIIRSSPSGGESDVLSDEFNVPMINITI